MPSPYSTTPHPWARIAAEEVVGEMHAYMREHPESELHWQGKMFGVLVVETKEKEYRYLKAFSSVLDGKHEMAGFVPPVFDFTDPNGYFRQQEAVISSMKDPSEERKQKSRLLQRWLFSQYRMLSASGEPKNLLEVFRAEKPILSEEVYFSGERSKADNLPPAGSGECCAPKLLQYALKNQYKPLALAEFWIGAPDARELRQEGYFYGACMGKCRPILRHMLLGIETDDTIEEQLSKEELKKKVRVLYEDDYLLVALKPAGLLTIPGKRDMIDLERCLQELRGLEYVKAVHRLDQDTSGIVVCVKEASLYSVLQKQFSSRKVVKRYEAVVCPQAGCTIMDKGTISLPLLLNPLDRPRQMVDYRYGKPAETRYEVRKRLPNGWVCLNLYPMTGRTHQLRVHCAHPDGLNAPIKGDRLYGKPDSRLFLHAAEIRFSHPVTGSSLKFSVHSEW